MGDEISLKVCMKQDNSLEHKFQKYISSLKKSIKNVSLGIGIKCLEIVKFCTHFFWIV